MQQLAKAGTRPRSGARAPWSAASRVRRGAAQRRLGADAHRRRARRARRCVPALGDRDDERPAGGDPFRRPVARRGGGAASSSTRCKSGRPARAARGRRGARTHRRRRAPCPTLARGRGAPARPRARTLADLRAHRDRRRRPRPTAGCTAASSAHAARRAHRARSDRRRPLTPARIVPLLDVTDPALISRRPGGSPSDTRNGAARWPSSSRARLTARTLGAAERDDARAEADAVRRRPRHSGPARANGRERTRQPVRA